MDRCPVCEGLTQLSEDCPSCGAPMEDCGNIENYWDAYGPYEEKTEDIISDSADSDRHPCMHFLQCPNCDVSVTRTVGRDTI